ncbi:MAG: IS110 family transposase [Planctomycetes bacterium]|nr:IS110 family transposase [Planctomycetota bacterium]
MDSNYQHFVGIDWATVEHEVHAMNAEGKRVSACSFKHSGDGLADLCTWLHKLGDPATIAVAIEVPHGAVVETLLDRGFVVFSINPKQLDRFRDRFTVAGAKDDRRDAMVLADSLRTDGHLFRRLAAQPAKIIELREWSRMHDELQGDRNAIVNQMRAQLARYFPAFLVVAGDPGEDWATRLLELVPNHAAALATKPARVTKLLKEHRIRRIDAEEVLKHLRSTPVFSAPGTATAAIAHLELLGERVRLVNKQLRACKAKLESSLGDLAKESPEGQRNEQRDVTIIQTMPGIGVIVAATLLGEAAGPLRERDYPALRALAGVAPVTRRSGKKLVVVMRTACHPRVRNALYHWSRVAVQNDPVAKARYAALRARGKSHGQSLRAVADRLLGVLCAMLRDQTEYRPPQEVAAA